MVADIQQRTGQVVEQIRQLSADLHTGVEQVEHAGEQLQNIASLAADVEGQVNEIAQGTETNRAQLDSLFHAVEQMRSDLTVSDEQTRQLADAAVQMEGQAETISERLAAVGLDDYHQRVYDLACEPHRRTVRGRCTAKPRQPGGSVRPQLRGDPQHPPQQVPHAF